MTESQELYSYQNSEVNSNNQNVDIDAQTDAKNYDNIENKETTCADVERSRQTVSQLHNYNQCQLNWMNKQVSNLERELLLNNRPVNSNFMSNWTKVILSALAVFIPGIGQLVGIILGLVFVSDDLNADKRSFGAALITVSVVTFIISTLFWFIFAMIFGPQLYY